MFLKIKFFLYFIFLIISTFLINVSNGQSTEVCSRRCLSSTNCVYEAKTSIVLACNNNDDFLNWYKGNSNVSISTDEDGSINDTISYRKQRCPPLPNQTKSKTYLVINSLSSTDSGPGIYKVKEYQEDSTFKCRMNIFVYGNRSIYI